MGPGPPLKKKERDKEREKERENYNRGLGTSGSAITGISSADTMAGSEDVEGREIEQERDSGEGWNRKRYQREDEILWGFDGSENGQAPIIRSRSSSNKGHYYARNPEVNDLHPPIVSTPRDRSQTRWMLQPPPSAKVMEGKERANRSRSDSGLSGRSNASSRRTADTNLGRRVGEKLLEERMRRGDVASTESIISPKGLSRVNTTTESVPSPKALYRENTGMNPAGQRHDREGRLSNESHSTTDSQRKPPPPPITISTDLRPPASRPPLSTVVSQTHVEQPTNKPKRPTLVPMDSTSSLHVLQELVSPLNLNFSPTSKLSSSKLNAMARSPSPLAASTIKLPPVNAMEDRELAIDIPKQRWSVEI